MAGYEPGPGLSIYTTQVPADAFNDLIFDPTAHDAWVQYTSGFYTLDVINGNLTYVMFPGEVIPPSKIKHGAFSRGTQIAQNLNLDVFKDILRYDDFVIPGACVTINNPYLDSCKCLVTYNIMISNSGTYLTDAEDDKNGEQPQLILLHNDDVVKYCGKLQPGINTNPTLYRRWVAHIGRRYYCGHAYLTLPPGTHSIGLALRGSSTHVRVHARAIRTLLLKSEYYPPEEP